MAKRDSRDAPSPAISLTPLLRDEALHGLAGQIVRTIEPQTEGHPAALLLQLLVTFGFLIGRDRHYLVEADKHFPNLFGILVGATAKARKGTSWGWILRIFTGLPDWPSESVKNGLSSGEGLIEQVSGTSEKRLLVVEGEFAAVLQVLMRTGNTLSAQLRSAWDSRPLSVLTKRAPATAPEAHIAIIGHITADEVVRLLATNEVGNGFANRFLWCFVHRSKSLPDGGCLDDAQVNPLREQLADVIAWVRKRKSDRLTFDQKAHQRWRAVYEGLSEGRPGLVGAVTCRAEAQVVRLALIYAILAKSQKIRLEHLEAALAVWEYCASSAQHIFGSSLGDPTADAILEYLSATSTGLSRTEINNRFRRHRTSAELDRALGLLQSQQLARQARSPTRGRPEERWFAVSSG